MAPTEVKTLYLQFLPLLTLIWVSRMGASDTMFNDSVSGHSVVSRNENPKGRCPHGWFISPNRTKCYGFMSSPKSWNESENQCNGLGGNLASLITYQEFSFAQNMCNGTFGGCWVGGRVFNSSNNLVWKWSDNVSKWNDSIIPSTASQSNCKNVSCRMNDLIETCALIVGGLAAPFLRDEKCNSSHPFICMINLDDRCQRMHCHKEYLVILAVVSGLIFCTTFAVVIWLLAYKRSKKRRRSRKVSNPAASALVPPSWKVFTKEELRSITKNFSEGNCLLGDTKTGGTYSGLLPDGSRVAIKRLNHSEIARVARLRHPSLVALKGCCYNHGDRYIVYEFVVNGPLDRWLHHVPRGGRSLDWTMRMKIATTLAQGIAFLHDKVKPHVVHRDIRASNVLLDEEFGAHLMGVGLSKLVAYEAMHERTVMAGGTYGYLAPEFVYRNELTTKSDVYSFGVLLLEIVTGRRPTQAVDSVGWQSIFEWATPLVQAHRYLDLLDPCITGSSTSGIPECGVVQKVVDLVYACTQHVPSMRPRMSHVVHQLQQLAPSPLTMK
ncbi:C-type lectin receptor-like tyrosine-protein kinase At1g52310 isoform X2 [Cucurbita moschata]|uniref:C-type lectin receptor-like tyrosine-protein kinase At1g52310 isoform X2 n=1 Tax=Cucurbita moschata TaxID=3662 RepID=A0A6J1E7X5_CUCMO|nr:C-type lectin receptor-like tyrosine-protein kinase At1g52310 isoform X2 [Cucurbita moschata]